LRDKRVEWSEWDERHRRQPSDEILIKERRFAVTDAKQRLGFQTTAALIKRRSLSPKPFAALPDGSTVTIGVNKLQVSYEGGDGNHLTLTVMP
jgi:hypothetical protein